MPQPAGKGRTSRDAEARAFAPGAPILLCDEPFPALDELTAQRLRGEFAALVRETGRTAVFITCPINEAPEIGGRVVVPGAAGAGRIGCGIGGGVGAGGGAGAGPR